MQRNLNKFKHKKNDDSKGVVIFVLNSYFNAAQIANFQVLFHNCLMRKTFQYFLVAFLLILTVQTYAFACECTGEPDFEKMFQESDAVISGEAAIVETFGLRIVALLRVEKSWKGVKQDKVIITSDPGSCGTNFEAGKKYNLWVDGSGDNFVTIPCRDYGEKQLSYLESKPTLTLLSANSDFNGNIDNLTEVNSNNDQNSIAETNSVQTKKTSKPEQTDLALIFAFSVTAIVVLVVSIIVGFFFWKNRKK